MVVVGADVHKRTHTFVAVDQVGKRARAADRRGHQQGHLTGGPVGPRAVRRAIWCGRSRIAGTCRPGWSATCSTAGQPVVRVPPKMMAEQRRIGRTRGKSDPIDALAVARAVLREPDLPVAIARRGVAGAEAAGRPAGGPGQTPHPRRSTGCCGGCTSSTRPRRRRSRARWTVAKHQQALADWLVRPARASSPSWRATSSPTSIELTGRINAARAGVSPPWCVDDAPALCWRCPAVGALTAAKIVGETAGVTRFKSRGRVRPACRDRTRSRSGRATPPAVSG